jgi:hypothetical protein
MAAATPRKSNGQPNGRAAVCVRPANANPAAPAAALTNAGRRTFALVVRSRSSTRIVHGPRVE